MVRPVKQKIDLPVCPFALQECNLGAADPGKVCPMTSVDRSDWQNWKRKAESLSQENNQSGCQFAGSKMSAIGYESRYKLVRPSRDDSGSGNQLRGG